MAPRWLWAARACCCAARRGAGKSDLAMRLIDGGARLVADDQTELARRDDVVVASCPATIVGLIEVRGLGILRLPAIDEAPLALLVDLVEAAAIEQLPDAAALHETLLGLAVPRLSLDPRAASAAAKIRVALSAFAGRAGHDILDPDGRRPG